MTDDQTEAEQKADPGVALPLQGWTRRHVVFLAISASAVFAIILVVHEILLPFILALIIAYVLTPAVAACERLRVPRSASILLVYAIVLGSLYQGIAAAAPRLYRETAGLFRDAPTMVKNPSNWIRPEIRCVGGQYVSRQCSANRASNSSTSSSARDSAQARWFVRRRHWNRP